MKRYAEARADRCGEYDRSNRRYATKRMPGRPTTASPVRRGLGNSLAYLWYALRKSSRLIPLCVQMVRNVEDLIVA